MRFTEDNMDKIRSFVAEYRILNPRHLRDADLMKLAMDKLVETYTSACKDMDSATSIHKAVMRNEEYFPAPATIRKWLRKLNHVERDIDKDSGV